MKKLPKKKKSIGLEKLRKLFRSLDELPVEAQQLRRMWQKSIENAFVDFIGSWLDPHRIDLNRQQAISWLRTNDFKETCDLAGVTSQCVLQIFEESTEEAAQHFQAKMAQGNCRYKERKSA